MTTRHPGGRPRLPIDTHTVLTAYADGQSITQIANQLGVDRSRVRRVVHDHGVLRDDRGAHWATKRQQKEAS